MFRLHNIPPLANYTETQEEENTQNQKHRVAQNVLLCIRCHACVLVFMRRTLSSVFLVQEFGLTVGQDLDFRRLGALGHPRRHHSVEVLQTGHLWDTGPF